MYSDDYLAYILIIVRLILRQAQDAVPFMVSLSNHHDEVCGYNSLLFTCPGHFWLVDAVRLFGKVVACVVESARPATFTDLLVLACPAFAFQQLWVTQFLKDRGIVPDIYEFLFLHVTCLYGQVTAWENLSLV